MAQKQAFYIHKLANGMTLLGEEIEHVSSAAISVLVPMGSALDPLGGEGASALLGELYNKGAGPWNAQELSDQFESIGLEKSHSSGIEVSVFSGACLAENLIKGLELLSVMLLEPRLAQEELESVKQLALQDLKALEDEPSSKVMSELAQEFYPYPFGRSQLGTKEGIEALTIEALREFYEKYFVPSHAILAVAGKFNWDELTKVVEARFGGWSGQGARLEVGSLGSSNKTRHLERSTSQVQIALAYPSVSFEHPQYYAARVGVSILSGGMSGRLFIEVREKRGLVYRVSASHSAAKNRAAIFASAGTTPENAQQTLQVMLGELSRVGQNISDEELGRAKADLKSRLIMQSELTSVRAPTLVNDWWNLGALRSLEEIKAGIEAVSIADIAAYAENWPVAPITLATLGPKKLELPA